MIHTSVPGKIILSGEYAVVFGYAGVAVPASVGVEAIFEEDALKQDVEVCWEGSDEPVKKYLEKVVALCQKHSSHRGRLTVRSSIPIGKGMGSSTAFVIAISRALLGNEREVALRIEDEINPGHSGLDFETIWGGVPVLFRKGAKPERVSLPLDLLKGAVLIDTGSPTESTTELVAWMRGRESEVSGALKIIGDCTVRLAEGEPLLEVMRDHHAAQVALGVVPQNTQDLISAIEKTGGAAKVVGAGGRSGGGGMVLAIGDNTQIIAVATKFNLPVLNL